jgi:hypothetical protein
VSRRSPVVPAPRPGGARGGQDGTPRGPVHRMFTALSFPPLLETKWNKPLRVQPNRPPPPSTSYQSVRPCGSPTSTYRSRRAAGTGLGRGRPPATRAPGRARGHLGDAVQGVTAPGMGALARPRLDCGFHRTAARWARVFPHPRAGAVRQVGHARLAVSGSAAGRGEPGASPAKPPPWRGPRAGCPARRGRASAGTRPLPLPCAPRCTARRRAPGPTTAGTGWR